MDPVLPPFTGTNLPVVGVADTDTPLVRLVRRLYTAPAPCVGVPVNMGRDLPLLSFEHESKMLCEPFVNARGVSTRACLQGSDCIGKNPSIPGYEDTNVNGAQGIVLTELMTPEELTAFTDADQHPAERRCCVLCARYFVHTAYLHARKQRTFPPNSLLNMYVNANGENEYSQEFLIPTPDDGGWSGVCGTVCGLHLNALRFVKTQGEAVWRINQDALKYVVKTVSNTNPPSLYRNAVDPQAWLLHFFQHRIRLVDASVLFLPFEELAAVRPKLDTDNLRSTVFLPWPDEAIKSFTHRLLFYRVNRLNHMLVDCGILYGARWSYNMQLFIDAHVSMVLMFEAGQKISTFQLKYPAYEQVLPDLSMLAVQAAMNVVVEPGLPPKERKKAMTRPRAMMVQMLIRSLPEYSQTRSLHSHFVRCLASRDMTSTVFAILQAALMGNFERCTDRAPYATRKRFLAEFTETTALAMVKELPANEHLLLYVMRMYLLTVVPFCPPLENLIITLSPMRKQTAKVFDSMRMVRQAASRDWRLMFSLDVLETIRKNHKRLPKKKLMPRGLADCSDSLLLNARRTATRRDLKRGFGAAFDVATYQAASNLFQRVKRTRVEDVGALIPVEMSCAFEGAANEMLAKSEATPMKRPLLVFAPTTISTDNVARLCDFAAALDHAMLAQVTPLPEGLLRMQHLAVAKRFSCAADDWATLQRVTRLTVCANCGLRNFSLLQCERSPPTASMRRTNNTRSAGFKKLAWNVDTGELRCVEGVGCAHLPLTVLDVLAPTPDGGLTGGAVVMRDVSITISPCCGFLCATSGIRLTPTGWDCPNCAASKRAIAEEAPDPRICAHCSRRSQLKQALTQTAMLRDARGRVQTYGFCRSHYRSWARTKTGYMTLDYVSKNILNRTGAGLVINPT